MKVKDVAEKYGIDKDDFLAFLDCEHLHYDGFFNTSIDDDNVEEYVKRYRVYKEIDEETILKKKEEKEQKEKKQLALSQMLISSGFSFEGYNIIKYSGYISGDDAVEIPRGGIFGNNHGQNLTDALVKIRRKALQELKEAAYDLGCNAIIGVDFDYLTLEPETVNLAGGTRYEPYVICVTANGNAVIIEKEDNNIG